MSPTPAQTARRVRFVKNPHPGARRPDPPRRAPAKNTGPRRERDLPGWKDLASDDRQQAHTDEGRLAAMPTLRMAGLIALATALVTLYVGHVHATQQIADRVQALSRENLTLHLHFNQVKGQFDQATSPAVVTRRARALGLSEAVPNGFAIRVEEGRP